MYAHSEREILMETGKMVVGELLLGMGVRISCIKSVTANIIYREYEGVLTINRPSMR